MPALIEDYAMVGDGHTAALISRDGSVDWLCWPRFDSGACFTSLLGTPEHGRWLLAPAGAIRSAHRPDRDDTLILQTVFETAEGAVVVIDFMPVRDGTPHLVRIVKGLRGKVEMRMELAIRFDYGAIEPWVSKLPDGSGIKAVGGPD